MGISLVVLGNKPLTLEVARFVLRDSRFYLAGIMIGEESSSNPSVRNLKQFAALNDIPMFDSESLEDADFGRASAVSIGYPQILRNREIAAFDKIINLHFGELPWYRGSATVSHAILNAEAHFGMTLHRIDEGVDTGPIYRIDRFPIEHNALACDIIERAEFIGLQMLRESLAQICRGELPEIPQETLLGSDGRIPTQYYRKSLGALKVIDGTQSLTTLLRQYRAGRLPGQPMPVIQFDSRYFGAKDLAELKDLIMRFHPERVSSVDSA